MSQALTVFEREVEALRPRYEPMLLQVGVLPAVFARSLLNAVMATPKLMDCGRDSLIRAVDTLAHLGLVCDGVTGQGYILPFNDRTKGMIAQAVPGWQGFVTIGARGGWTMQSAAVRAGDVFDYDLGTRPAVLHRPKMDGAADRPVIAAYAVATRPGASPLVTVLPLADILAVKARAPGAKRPGGPWDTAFPAMAAKTALRRLAKFVPMGAMQRAAALDEHAEMGNAAWIDAASETVHVQSLAAGDAAAIEGPAEGASEGGGSALSEAVLQLPPLELILSTGEVKAVPDVHALEAFIVATVPRVRALDKLGGFVSRNEATLHEASRRDKAAGERIWAALAAAEKRLKEIGA